MGEGTTRRGTANTVHRPQRPAALQVDSSPAEPQGKPINTGVGSLSLLQGPSSLPIPSLWVIPVHQPQASCILHRTWTGNSFLIYGVAQSQTRLKRLSSSISRLVKAGDPGSIPGSDRSSGEGIGYPLQYYWASLVAQLVKNPPAVRETWVRSLSASGGLCPPPGVRRAQV